MVLAVGIALAVYSQGCTFERQIVNADRRDVDIAFIETGTTTWLEVVRALGPPDVGLKDLRTLMYTSSDHKKVGLRLGMPSLFWLPFNWSDAQRVEELLIELDEDGVVTDVSRSWRDTVWTPLEGEHRRDHVRVELLTGGG
jgi:hypothetical protein